MSISFGCAVWLSLMSCLWLHLGNAMKKILLSLLFSALACISFAREVSSVEVRQAASRWMKRSPGFESYEIGSVEALSFKDVSQPIYLIDLEPQGYMLMGSDRAWMRCWSFLNAQTMLTAV